jgi:hypothetical protein
MMKDQLLEGEVPGLLLRSGFDGMETIIYSKLTSFKKFAFVMETLFLLIGVVGLVIMVAQWFS